MKRGYIKFVAISLAIASTMIVACHNQVIEKWWGDNQGEAIWIDGGGGGGTGDGAVGGGANFGSVVFDASGGVPNPKALHIAWGNTIGRLRPMSRDVQGFLGWFDENGNLWDLEARPVKPEDDIDGDEFITLIARWSSSALAVTFVTGPSPTNIPNQLIGAGGRIVQPVNPAAPGDGRAFAGWWERDGTGNNWGRQWDFANNTISGPVTLYARWEYQTRTVVLHTNGGTRPDGTELTRTQFTIPVGFGKIQDPGPLVREGYSFGGWFTEPGFYRRWDFATDTITEPDASPGANPFNLYIRWIRNVYVVSFAVRSSTASQPDIQEVPHGETVTQPAVANPAGVLLGWYADPNLTIRWNFDTDRVKSNQTLFADWEVTPDFILRQVRIVNVSFIDFAGNSIDYNAEWALVRSTPLTHEQMENNVEAILAVAKILDDHPTFLLQLAGHANPVTQDLEAELPELEAVSRARANAVLRELADNHGIAETRIINVGFNPRNLTSDPNHASLNRCVEMVVIEIMHE